MILEGPIIFARFFFSFFSWQTNFQVYFKETSSFSGYWFLLSFQSYDRLFYIFFGLIYKKIKTLYRVFFSMFMHVSFHYSKTFCHINFLYNLVTKLYVTIIFQIPDLYVRSLDLWACSKLGVYFDKILFCT